MKLAPQARQPGPRQPKRDLMTVRHEDDGDDEGLDAKLQSLDEFETSLRHKVKELFDLNHDMYLADWYVFGALRRMMALTKGFRRMVEDRNFLCAAPLVRLQLDNALRIFALSLVSNPNALASKLLDGEPLSRQKDDAGKRLRDAYLVGRLSAHHDWVEALYEETSGFVHLSERHFFAAIVQTNDEDHTVRFSLSADDGDRDEAEYLPVVRAFHDAQRLTGEMVVSYMTARAAVGQGPASSAG